jgi:hypothetical protein
MRYFNDREEKQRVGGGKKVVSCRKAAADKTNRVILVGCP